MNGLDHRVHVLADSPDVEASMGFDLEELPACREGSVGDEEAASVEGVDIELMEIVPAARTERESPRDTPDKVLHHGDLDRGGAVIGPRAWECLGERGVEPDRRRVGDEDRAKPRDTRARRGVGRGHRIDRFQDELDVDVRIEFQDRSSGKIVKRFHRCRLIGVREGGAFRMWITNLTREQATASEVSALYAARWEIEIFFRELKTIWRADQIPTSGEAATRCLLYASMLTVLFSRELRHALFERDARERVPLERWARLVRCLLVELAALITSRAGRSKRELHRRLDWLRRESFDPNRRRRPAHLRLADVVRDHA